MPINVSWLLPVGAVLIGTLFVVRGVQTLTADRQRRESWLTFPGRVVASRTVSSGFDDLTADQTQCQVAYVRDGREIVFWNRFTSTTALTSPDGRAVEVLVNPDDPADAVVSRGLTSGGTRGVLLTGAGGFFMVVGLVLAFHL